MYLIFIYDIDKEKFPSIPVTNNEIDIECTDWYKK